MRGVMVAIGGEIAPELAIWSPNGGLYDDTFDLPIDLNVQPVSLICICAFPLF